MGYDFHITRKADWSDKDGPTIAEAEWRDLVASDPELTIDADTRCWTTDGEWLFVAWRGEAGALAFLNGEITSTNPDEPLIRKMVEIAERLGATVQGDDGERYPDALDARAARRPSWWRRLLGRGLRVRRGGRSCQWTINPPRP